MLSYRIGSSGEVVHLEESVVAHFRRHRQLRFWHKEAGGQLFARIEGQDIFIAEATGPRPGDRRGRTYYAADREVEQEEIDAMHKRGLHYVGDWHSHPERRPHPSPRDDETMASRVRLSRHRLGGFIFIIVGQAEPPDGVTLVVHDGQRWHRLTRAPDPKGQAASG